MPDPAENWINTFPAIHQPTVSSWFTYATSQGARTPEAVVMIVERLVGHKLDWAVAPESRQLCHNALQALRCDRGGSGAYAQYILGREKADADE